MTDRTASVSLRILGPRARLLGTGDGDALQNVNTTELPNGAVCYVIASLADFRLHKDDNTTPPDGINVIAPGSGPGRWFIEVNSGAGLQIENETGTVLPARPLLRTRGQHPSDTGTAILLDDGENDPLAYASLSAAVTANPGSQIVLIDQVHVLDASLNDPSVTLVFRQGAVLQVPASRTIGVQCDMTSGGLIQPANGVTVTHTAPVMLPDTAQGWDVSLGGSVAFDNGVIANVLPQYFGACGNGSNATVQFVAALASAKTMTKGASVHVVPGHYVIDLDQLSLTSPYPLYVYGEGFNTHIEATGTGDTILFGQSSDCTVEGIRFTGTCTWAVRFLRPAGTNISNCIVEKCWFVGVANQNPNAGNAAVYWEGVDRGVAINVTTSGNGIAGTPGIVDLTDTSGVLRNFAIGELEFVDSVNGQKYRNTSAFALPGNGTIAVSVTNELFTSIGSAAGDVTIVKTFTTGAALANATCTNPAPMVFTNPLGYELLWGINTTDHNSSGAVNCNITMTNTIIGVAAFNAANFNASGNTVDGGGFANGTWTNVGYGIMVYREPGGSPKQARVVGNYINNCSGSGLYLQTVPNSTVVGNIIENCALKQDDVSLPAGNYSVSGSDYSTVCGNVSIDGGKQGIVVSSGLHNTITGNTVRNAGASGIQLRAGPNFATVTGNTVDTPANHGIFAGEATTNLTIIGNTVNSPASEGILCVNASRSNVSDNIVSAAPSHAILWQAGSGNGVRGNFTQSTFGPDIFYQGDDGVVTGNVCNPTGATAIDVQGNTNAVHDNRLLSGVVVDAGVNSDLDKNRYNTGPTHGIATLGAGGTVAVASNEIQAGDSFNLVRVTQGAAPGFISYTVVAGTLTINSSSAADNANIYWEVIH